MKRAAPSTAGQAEPGWVAAVAWRRWHAASKARYAIVLRGPLFFPSRSAAALAVADWIDDDAEAGPYEIGGLGSLPQVQEVFDVVVSRNDEERTVPEGDPDHWLDGQLSEDCQFLVKRPAREDLEDNAGFDAFVARLKRAAELKTGFQDGDDEVVTTKVFFWPVSELFEGEMPHEDRTLPFLWRDVCQNGLEGGQFPEEIAQLTLERLPDTATPEEALSRVADSVERSVQEKTLGKLWADDASSSLAQSPALRARSARYYVGYRDGTGPDYGFGEWASTDFLDLEGPTALKLTERARSSADELRRAIRVLLDEAPHCMGSRIGEIDFSSTPEQTHESAHAVYPEGVTPDKLVDEDVKKSKPEWEWSETDSGEEGEDDKDDDDDDDDDEEDEIPGWIEHRDTAFPDKDEDEDEDEENPPNSLLFFTLLPLPLASSQEPKTKSARKQ
jgi:hypothetical protein